MSKRYAGDVINRKKAGRAAAKVSPWGQWRSAVKGRKRIPKNPRKTTPEP